MEFYWILLKCIMFLLESIGFLLELYWDSLEMHWFVLESIGFVLELYWDSIEMYLLLLESISFFHWICICGGGAQVARGPREARNH